MIVEEKVHFSGIPAYPGVIYAKCKKLKSQELLPVFHQTDISPEDRILEETFFLQSIDQTEQELEIIIQENEKDQGLFELRGILNSQKDMVRDPLLVDSVLERIHDLGETAGLAVENTIQRLYEDFLALDDEYFRDRSDHIQDIGKRITKNLYIQQQPSPQPSYEFLEPVILIAKEISPTEMVGLDKSKILGIATDQGGKTGHMAIIARSYGIPTIVGLKNLSSYIEDGEYILLDAERGFVKRNPDIEEVKLYGLRTSLKAKDPSLAKDILKTLDGEKVVLKVNLESDEDCDDLQRKNVQGIGLYRSEVLFLQFISHTPTEEEQFSVYKRILKKMSPKPVVIRVFDIGADKYEIGAREDNPFLGNRGIRYLLRHPNLFKEQLRALLRASVYGQLEILLPMISTIKEIKKTKQLIQECKDELSGEGIDISHKIPLGIMVETPACAFGLEEYCKHVDFLSIGTNDLLQYLMAVERNNYSISDLYNPLHFVFLEVLEGIAMVANKKKIPVSICGEIATDPDMTGILLAMGYRELSVSPPFLLSIQERVMNLKIKDEKKQYKKIKQLAVDEKFYELEDMIKQDVPLDQ